jgi:DNA-binding NarL/FixJ family response regulator
MDTLGVLIVDDHPIFRSGMRALLSSVPGIEITGEALNGDQAIEQASSLQPDVVLMDLHMPGGISGIEATRRILATSPHIRVLVVTMFEDDDSVFAALRAGARGYMLKGSGPKEMVRAIQAVGNGEAIFSPTIAQRLIDFFAAPRPKTMAAPIFPDLTDRERAILNFMVQGDSNQDIATRLVLSLKTVRNHVSNIFSKLQVADRAQAILLARDAGWCEEKG